MEVTLSNPATKRSGTPASEAAAEEPLSISMPAGKLELPRLLEGSTSSENGTAKRLARPRGWSKLQNVVAKEIVEKRCAFSACIP